MATVLFISLSFLMKAQETEFEKRWMYSFEIDPLPYIMGGVGGHIGFTPKKSDHVSFGLSFISNMNYPDALINISDKNKDMGWHMKINQGMGIWTHYYFKEANEGWFAGLQLFTQEAQLENDDYPNEINRTNLVMAAFQAGYHIYPFKNISLYLRPWAGFGYQTAISATFEPDAVTKDMIIGEKEYDLNNFMPFATIHIGYTFTKNRKK
jgi:hypothetical protein